MKTFAATALIILSVQAAWADCDALKRQGAANLAAATEAGNRYRPIAAEHLADRLRLKDNKPSTTAISAAIPETERMIEAMNMYLDYMVSVKDGGCWGPESESAQSMVITIFKGQRDQLVTDLKSFTEFVKPHQ